MLSPEQRRWRVFREAVADSATGEGAGDISPLHVAPQPRKFLVRMIGLEPTLPRGNWNLNPARLPVSPHPHASTNYSAPASPRSNPHHPETSALPRHSRTAFCYIPDHAAAGSAAAATH